MKATPDQKAANDVIINEMIRQIGGRRFFTMTGAKPQYKDNGATNPMVMMKLPRNKTKGQYMSITYVRVTDTYSMEWIKLTKAARTVVAETEGIYSDMLESTFTHYTGIYTSL